MERNVEKQRNTNIKIDNNFNLDKDFLEWISKLTVEEQKTIIKEVYEEMETPLMIPKKR